MSHPTLTICLKVNDKPALVIGGGEIAWQKVCWLANSGVRVRVVSPRFIEPIETMAKKQPMALELERREYVSEDLQDCLVAIAATDRPDVNQAVARDAGQVGVPVNVVDQPDLCGFFVPSTVRRGDLTLAIGTGGACPPLSARIRRDLEQLYPESYGRLVETLERVRQWLLEKSVNYNDRRRILRALCEPALTESLRDLDVDSLEKRLLEQAQKLMDE